MYHSIRTVPQKFTLFFTFLCFLPGNTSNMIASGRKNENSPTSKKTAFSFENVDNKSLNSLLHELHNDSTSSLGSPITPSFDSTPSDSGYCDLSNDGTPIITLSLNIEDTSQVCDIQIIKENNLIISNVVFLVNKFRYSLKKKRKRLDSKIKLLQKKISNRIRFKQDLEVGNTP